MCSKYKTEMFIPQRRARFFKCHGEIKDNSPPTFQWKNRTARRGASGPGGESRKVGSRIPSICIVLSYFSVGTRIVWHRIIAFMANKRKAAPVRPAPSSATTVSPRSFRTVLSSSHHPPSAHPVPFDPRARDSYCRWVVPSTIVGVAIGFVFRGNIVRGLPGPVNRSTTLGTFPRKTTATGPLTPSYRASWSTFAPTTDTFFVFLFLRSLYHGDEFPRRVTINPDVGRNASSFGGRYRARYV